MLVTLRDGSVTVSPSTGKLRSGWAGGAHQQPIGTWPGPQGRLLLTEADALCLKEDTVRHGQVKRSTRTRALVDKQGWLIAGWRERVLLSPSANERSKTTRRRSSLRWAGGVDHDNDGTWCL